VDKDSGTPPDVTANDRTNAAPRDAADVQTQVRRLKEEIDSLRIAMAEKSRPGYTQLSIIIAIAAFLLSVSTTIYSAKRDLNQDVNSDRQELSTLIQRLSAIPKESLEARQKYPRDPRTVVALSTYLNEENSVIAKRAAEIIDRLPSDRISSAEYLAVSIALASSGAYDRSIEMIERGLPVAKDANELTGLLRDYGQILYDKGDYARGDQQFRKALDAFKTFPVNVTWYVESTQANTQLIWAQMAIAHHLCEEGRIHLQSANDHLFRAGNDRWGLNTRVHQLRAAASSCRSNSK
jgi:tetratricopeptide (TPR) repeat protein